MDSEIQCWKCGQPRPNVVAPCPYCSSGLQPLPGVHQTWQGTIQVPGPDRRSPAQVRHDKRVLAVLGIAFAVAGLVAALFLHNLGV